LYDIINGTSGDKMSQINRLTEGSIFKKLFNIALPVLLTSIMQMAYNLTDMFWVGRVDNIGIAEQDAISAIGTASYIVWFAFGLIIISKIGTSVKVSHAVGEDDESKISRYATNGLLLEIIIGVLFSVSVFIFRNQILAIFNISSLTVLKYASTYLSIVGGLLIFQFVSNGFAAINEGLGKTKTNFWIMLVGLVINMILDPILILVFRMGVSGAAIATVFAQAMTMLVYIIYYFLKNQKLHSVSFKALDFGAMKEIIRVGIPAGIQSIIFTSISIYIARMVFQYGEDVVAAQRVGVQVEQFTWMIAGGFQTAITVFVGQNFGARQYTRIRKGMKIMALILIPYAMVIASLLFFVPEFLIRIFIDGPVTVAYGVRYLRIISFAQLFMMLEAIGSGLFNGVGKTEIPSISGIISNVLRIPIAYLLIQSLQQEGIWWALNISDCLKGIVMLIGSIILLTMLEKLKLTERTVPYIESTEELHSA